jgi:hypothetical protein
MNGEADRRERIKAALTRYEASKAKRGKRKSGNLFDIAGMNHGSDGKSWERMRRGKVNDTGGGSNLWRPYPALTALALIRRINFPV